MNEIFEIIFTIAVIIISITIVTLYILLHIKNKSITLIRFEIFCFIILYFIGNYVILDLLVSKSEKNKLWLIFIIGAFNYCAYQMYKFKKENK